MNAGANPHSIESFVPRTRLALECAWEIAALGAGLAALPGVDPSYDDYCRNCLLARLKEIAEIQASLLDELSMDVWTLRARMVGREAMLAEQAAKANPRWWIDNIAEVSYLSEGATA